MFGFLGSKEASQRKSEAAVVASVKRAQNVWDYADLDSRTSLLKKVINTQDDRLFLAYVHAAWSQIPYSDQMKLVMEIMRLDGNDGLVKIMANRGIYLTPPTPRCSVWGHGRGLSEDFARTGTALQHRGSLC